MWYVIRWDDVWSSIQFSQPESKSTRRDKGPDFAAKWNLDDYFHSSITCLNYNAFNSHSINAVYETRCYSTSVNIYSRTKSVFVTVTTVTVVYVLETYPSVSKSNTTWRNRWKDLGIELVVKTKGVSSFKKKLIQIGKSQLLKMPFCYYYYCR